MFLYFKFLERDGNRGLGLLPLYSLDWIGLELFSGHMMKLERLPYRNIVQSEQQYTNIMMY